MIHRSNSEASQPCCSQQHCRCMDIDIALLKIETDRGLISFIVQTVGHCSTAVHRSIVGAWETNIALFKQ